MEIKEIVGMKVNRYEAKKINVEGLEIESVFRTFSSKKLIYPSQK